MVISFYDCKSYEMIQEPFRFIKPLFKNEWTPTLLKNIREVPLKEILICWL